MPPDGWRSVRLGDVIAKTVGGGTPTRSCGRYWGGTIPWATVKDFGPRVLVDTKEHITLDGLSDSSSNLVPEGTVVIATRMNVGALFLSGAPMAVNQDLRGLFPTPCLSKEYLLYSLQKRRTSLLRLATGTTVKGLRIDALKSLPLELPPLPEQRKIAAILSSVDEAIEKTEAVIDQVLIVKRGLVQELLTRGMPGRHTHFQQTPIGDIPADWDFRLLGALATPDRGLQTGPFGSQLHAADYSPRGVPVLMPKDMMDGRVSDSNSARVPEAKAEGLSRHRVKPGDLLFARRGDIGRVGVITASEEGWLCGTGCLRFRPKDPTVSPYLRYWTSWSKSVRWLNEHAVGQTMLNLNTSILGRLPVALPSESERSDIVEVLETLEKRVTTLEASVAGFRRVKSALMSVLLTGELRVTPDPEPE